MSLFEEISGYYRMQDSICICSEVNGLMGEMIIQHDPKERRIFICVSKMVLKTVLLNNGQVKLSISIDHSLAQKQTFHS